MLITWWFCVLDFSQVLLLHLRTLLRLHSSSPSRLDRICSHRDSTAHHLLSTIPLFLHQLDPTGWASLAYNIPFACKFLLPVDPQRLKRAFQSLLDRHAALRTVFVDKDGEVYQVVKDSSTLDWEEIALTPPERKNEQGRSSLSNSFADFPFSCDHALCLLSFL